MFKKEFVEKMKNDEELQELRRKVLSFSEKMGDAAYIIGKDKSYGIFISKKENCTGATNNLESTRFMACFFMPKHEQGNKLQRDRRHRRQWIAVRVTPSKWKGARYVLQDSKKILRPRWKPGRSTGRRTD